MTQEKWKPEITRTTLGWLETPFSPPVSLGIPQHAIQLHAEPDGYLMLGKKAGNAYEYSAAMLELAETFQAIEENCIKLEFNTHAVSRWINNIPALPRLSWAETCHVRDTVSKAFDKAATDIMTLRASTGKRARSTED